MATTALTPKEIQVIEEYLTNPRAGKTKAVQKVYALKIKPISAQRRASKFFKRIDVQKYMEKRRQEVRASSGVTFEYLVAKQRQVLERCMSITPVKDNKGKNTGEFQFNATGANRAIETLGKLTGAFAEDNDQKNKGLDKAAEAFGNLLKEVAGAPHKPGDF